MLNEMEQVYSYQLCKDKLHKKETGTKAKNCFRYYHLNPVFATISDMPYAVIKGEVLSKRAYGGLGYRNSGDVDILISRNNIYRLTKILCKYGFEPDLRDDSGNMRELSREEKIIYNFSHQVVPFVKRGDGKNIIILDVNVDIFWGEYLGKRVDMSEFLVDTMEMELYGVKIKALPDVKHFIALCLHHYKEMNAPYNFALTNPFNEKMFEDIYRFYHSTIQSKMKQVSEFVFRYGLEEVFYYLFFYTSVVFQDYDMQKDADIFKTKKGVEGLDYYGLNSNERKKWYIPFYERMNNQNLLAAIQSQLTQYDMNKMDLSLKILHRD